MTVFNRKIELKYLDQLGSNALPWLDDLFRFWAPAGSASRPGAPEALRFAIRNGYANFYAKGQSAARVSLGPRVIKASVHEKYFEQDSTKRALLGQKYKSFGPNNVTALPQHAVAAWIAVAAGSVDSTGYAGAEKTFVERLVAANANIVDLEMGLPAFAGSRSAVRMDIVALEPCGNGWKLVFWEAKMADNEDARAKGEAIPKVVDQQRRYHDWLNAPGRDRKADVLCAYQRVCRDLVTIHDRVGKSEVGADLPKLGEGIVAVANGAALTLDDNVRLIIDNSIGNLSFERDGHRAKLEEKGIFVHVVSKGGDHRLHSAAT